MFDKKSKSFRHELEKVFFYIFIRPTRNGSLICRAIENHNELDNYEKGKGETDHSSSELPYTSGFLVRVRVHPKGFT